MVLLAFQDDRSLLVSRYSHRVCRTIRTETGVALVVDEVLRLWLVATHTTHLVEFFDKLRISLRGNFDQVVVVETGEV